MTPQENQRYEWMMDRVQDLRIKNGGLERTIAALRLRIKTLEERLDIKA